jgi:hypothetical protein
VSGRADEKPIKVQPLRHSPWLWLKYAPRGKRSLNMNEAEKQARDVISSLRSYVEKIKEIQNLICKKRTFTSDERGVLQELLSKLKEDLKDASKRQTVQKDGRQPNEIEKAFFAPATFEASVHLSMKVNSHPIKSDWLGHLYNSLGDIEILLCQLLNLYPENNCEYK